MGEHRLGGIPNFGTTPPVRRMPPATPDAGAIQTTAFPSDDASQMPVEPPKAQTLRFPSDDAAQMPLPGPSAQTLRFPSDDAGQLPPVSGGFGKLPPKLDPARLDRHVRNALARHEAEGTPESQKALLHAVLKASSGYRQVAPEDPKGLEYSRQAIDLASEGNWSALKASEKERKDMKRAAQATYNTPVSQEQQENALTILRDIQVNDQGQTWAPGEIQTKRFPSDDAGQGPVEGPSMQTKRFPSDDAAQPPVDKGDRWL